MGRWFLMPEKLRVLFCMQCDVWFDVWDGTSPPIGRDLTPPPPSFYEPANEQKDNGNMRHRVLINTHYPNICCQDIFIWEHCYLFSPVYQINHVLFLGDLYWAVVRTLFARKINLSRQSLGGIGFAATTEDCIIRSGGQFVLPLGWLINKRVLIALKTAYRKVSVHDNRQTLTFLPYWLPFV